MLYHRKAMGTMRYSRWRGAHGAVSHFYNRTAMVEEVNPPGGSSGHSSGRSQPITLVDRKMLAYVHHTRERHFQLFRSYQQKTNSTQCKLHEGEMLRRRWHRRLQKSFISFMQFKTMKVLEEQAKWIHQYGQASVNASLGGDPWEKHSIKDSDGEGGNPPPHNRGNIAHPSLSTPGPESSRSTNNSAKGGVAGRQEELGEQQQQRRFAALRRKVQALPSIGVTAPKHVATMKQIHNDRFNYRWRVN